MELLAALGRTMGFSFAAGINLYATVAILGLAKRYGWVVLPEQFSVFDNDIVIAVAVVLYAVEFVADKIPLVDTVWDAVHTFVRVPAGAAVAASATSDLSPTVQVLALLLGGGLALSTHGTKATVRAAANTSPEPFSNWALSLLEDVVTVGAALLAVFNPVVILAVIIIFLLLVAWLLPKIVRRLRRMFAAARNFLRGRPVADIQRN
jgi:Domain of unknown function (DUF4126)